MDIAGPFIQNLSVPRRSWCSSIRGSVQSGMDEIVMCCWINCSRTLAMNSDPRVQLQTMQNLARAADFLSLGDVVSQMVRAEGNFGLLSTMGLVCTEFIYYDYSLISSIICIW